MVKEKKDIMNEKEYSVYNKPFNNIYDTLANSAKKFPDKTAIIDDNSEITYQQFQTRVDQMACFLQKDLCLKKNDRIGLLFVNCIDFLISFYAAVKIGCIAVMVNTKLQTDQIKFVLEDTKTKTLIMNSFWLDKVIDNITSLNIENIIFDKKELESEVPASTFGFNEIFNLYKGKNLDVKISDDIWQTAVIMHTSGTTGVPKGVMVLHRNILETSYGYEDVLGLDDRARTVLAVPIFHILGLSCVSTFFIYLGGTLILSAIYKTENVLQKITKYKPNHFHCVPTVFIELTKAFSPRYDLSSLKVTVCGGAPISKENIERFCEIAPNASFRIAYGMTETAGGGVLSPGHRLPGKPTPNVAVDIVNEQMKPVSTGMEGEVIFKGPCVIRNYWNGQTISEGHLASGDIARKDENNFIYVIDRKKDLINRGGEKIFPSMVEKAILGYPGILQAIVFPVSDDLYGEIPAAVVLVEEGITVEIKQVLEYIKGKIAKYEIPKIIEVWNHIPVTENGKVRKAELRKHFENKNNL